MKKTLILVLIVITMISCKEEKKEFRSDFTLSFGSCNNQLLANPFWQQLEQENPDVWIWGGDIIYSDTEDMSFLESNYRLQKEHLDYKSFIKNRPVLATWDDHDYGINDGGAEYEQKWVSQQLFLDFLDIPQNSPKRKQKGVYTSQDFKVDQHEIKIIVLDGRYFRSELKEDPSGQKRYIPDFDDSKTMLGKTQWAWLKNELNKSQADFNIIISSVQFLSDQHGFESWGNFPLEQQKLESLISLSQAKNCIILSGDRHISEFSKKEVPGLSYPLVDFTSSGMTHSYEGFKGEENPYRMGQVVPKKSYGILEFNFEDNKVLMKIRGEQNQTLEQQLIQY